MRRIQPPPQIRRSNTPRTSGKSSAPSSSTPVPRQAAQNSPNSNNIRSKSPNISNSNLKNQVQIKKKKQPSISRPIPTSKNANRNSNNNNNNNSKKFDPNMNLPPTHAPDFHSVLLQKLEICSKNLDPNFLPKNLDELKLKVLNLTHILRLVTENANKLKDEEQDLIVEMIMRNILRPLRDTNPNLLFAEVPQILPDPNWPHLDLVYLILNQIQINLPSLLTYNFAKALFPVLNSSDVNERIEMIHFFKEFMANSDMANNFSVRDEIMKDLTKILNMHIELSDRPFAVWTILPIFKDICDYYFLDDNYDSNNTNKNVHHRYDRVIKSSIIPLLRDKYSFYFYPLLNDILYFFTIDSCENAKYVVEQVLKYWPQTSVTKQSSYTTLLAEMLNRLSKEDLEERFLEPVFKLFAKEIVSNSPKLAESSLTVWLIPDIEKVMEKTDPQKVLEIIVPSIMKSANGHWWDGIRDIAMLIMSKIISKHNLSILKDVAVNSLRRNQEESRKKFDQWSQICQIAQDREFNVSGKMEQIEELYGDAFVVQQSPQPPNSETEQKQLNETGYDDDNGDKNIEDEKNDEINDEKVTLPIRPPPISQAVNA